MPTISEMMGGAISSEDESIFSPSLVGSDSELEYLRQPRRPIFLGSKSEAEGFHRPIPPQLSPDIKEDNMKLYSKADLLKISSFIRDEVVPNIKSEENGLETARLMADLVDQLGILKEALVDEDLLVNTRIERALFEIKGLKDDLPKSIIDMATEVLEAWAVQLQGPVELIKPNLFCKDGCMEGLSRAQPWQKKSEEERTMAMFGFKKYESVKGGKWNLAETFKLKPEDAYEFGNKGIEPGKWWLKPVCAARDGIIDGTGNPVTWDEDGVYAFVLADYVEEVTEEGRPPGSVFKYTMVAENPAKWKLLLNNLRREPVRILRHHRLGTAVAPKYGLRFDGMYNIGSIGINRSVTTGVEIMRVTITFNRARGQPLLKPAQAHPLAHEREDWEEYQQYKKEMRAAEIQAAAMDTGDYQKMEGGRPVAIVEWP